MFNALRILKDRRLLCKSIIISYLLARNALIVCDILLLNKINFSISVLAANNGLYLSLVKKSILTFNWLLMHLNTGVVKTMSPIELNLITNTLSFFCHMVKLYKLS